MSAGPQERYLRIFGFVLDSLKTEIERLLDNYDVENVQAELIPYIDGLIGWPTNFDLGENKRRLETLSAVPLYKIKGRDDANEAFIENIADWDVTTYHGWRYVFFLNDPLSLLPDPSSITVGLFGTPQDELRYLPTQQDWHCLNGLLLVLEPIEEITGGLTSTTINKIDRLLPDFVTSWANVNILVQTSVTEEEIEVPGEDLDELIRYGESPEVPEEDADTVWGPGILLLVLNESSRTLNTASVKMHHKDIGYTGTAPPPPYP